MTKIIANYLPQYHSIPENDMWWGKGYSDWVAVKNAKPLYKNHYQPKVPTSGNYYQLDNIEAIRWQAKLAKQYGIDGWGIYHYWFSDSLHLLDKPVILLNKNKDIDIDYMFIWDNASWKRTWSNVEKFANDWAPLYENQNDGSLKNGVLAELDYGNKDSWINHFNYLLPFFKDERYIKKDNKPVFAFFNQDNEPDTITEMCKVWNELAIQNGFSGMTFIGKRKHNVKCIMDYEFTYEPEWNGWMPHNFAQRVLEKAHRESSKLIKKPIFYNYDKVWSKIIKHAQNDHDDRTLYGAFVSYDDTPRRGVNGRVIKGDSPLKFKKYLKKLLEISNEKKKDFIFITAWNEWGEGAYLEPDERHGEEYLQSIHSLVKDNSK